MDSDEFSAFSNEEEVLLQDGIRYEILEKTFVVVNIPDEETQRTVEKQCHVITLKSIGDKYSRANFLYKFIQNILK